MLDGWAADPYVWVRRAGLLGFIRPLRTGVDFARFARKADALLDDGDFFIRKAIGWVLREAGKTRPDEVAAWLTARASRASGITMREAVKYLGDERRRGVLSARGNRSSRT